MGTRPAGNVRTLASGRAARWPVFSATIVASMPPRACGPRPYGEPTRTYGEHRPSCGVYHPRGGPLWDHLGLAARTTTTPSPERPTTFPSGIAGSKAGGTEEVAAAVGAGPPPGMPGKSGSSPAQVISQHARASVGAIRFYVWAVTVRAIHIAMSEPIVCDSGKESDLSASHSVFSRPAGREKAARPGCRCRGLK